MHLNLQQKNGRKNEWHQSEQEPKGVEYVIIIICNLYDLVYRQVFYIWTESILGNLEVALYRGIFPGDINRNGGRRFGLYRISATAHWWDYWTYRIEIINQMKEIRAYV